MKVLYYPEWGIAQGCNAWTISQLCSGDGAEAAGLSSHPAPAAQI